MAKSTQTNPPANAAVAAAPDQKSTSRRPPGWRSRTVDRSLERAAKRSVERGQAFIDAALALLDESGGTGFTLQEVADRARQSTRTFYQLFGGKDDLILAMFEELCQLHFAAVEAALADVTDPAERVRTALTSAIRAGSHHQPANRLRGILSYRNALAVTHPEQLAEAEADLIDLLRKVVQEATDAGVMEGDVDHVVWLMTTLRTAWIESVHLGDDLGLRVPTSEWLADVCLRGCAN